MDVSGCRDLYDDLPWYDSDGPTYTCAWYAQGSNCQHHGVGYAGPPPPPGVNWWPYAPSYTANQACCACGGGEIVTSRPCDEGDYMRGHSRI